MRKETGIQPWCRVARSPSVLLNNIYLIASRTQVLLGAFAETPVPRRGQCALPAERSGDAKNSTVEEDLPQTQVDPVPHQERFKRTERSDEGGDAWREKVRGLRTDVCPLSRDTSVSAMAAQRMRKELRDVPDRGGRPMAQPKRAWIRQRRMSEAPSVRDGRCGRFRGEGGTTPRRRVVRAVVTGAPRGQRARIVRDHARRNRGKERLGAGRW